MRRFIEPSCRNLLRKPLVFGVPFFGLLSLSTSVIVVQTLGQGTEIGNTLAISLALGGYLGLLALTRFAKVGWEESWLFALEQLIFRRKSTELKTLDLLPTRFSLFASDTLDESDLLQAKAALEERVLSLRKGERLTLHFSIDEVGATLHEVKIPNTDGNTSRGFNTLLCEDLPTDPIVYSLCDLPVVTDPLWLPSQLQRLAGSFRVVVTIQGLDPHSVRNQIDSTRKRNARTSTLAAVEDDVAFEESTRVLQGLARGDDCIVEFSLIVIANQDLDLDPRYFHREKRAEISINSALGLRPRLHRSFWVRVVTATDLIPNILDPKELGVAVLKTPREKALTFDPLDSRLEALHWLTIGASGSGKSFFTGLLLLRMLQLGVGFSVLFIDHGRSFRRLVRRKGGTYNEPKSSKEMNESVEPLFAKLSQPGGLAGIELSDLTIAEKREATHDLLSQVEHFLRTRASTHPVYVVMDECWNFMRDEPVLVQRFFREFRKLNGAAVAITQSLSDFLSDESGRSILQNAPIRILLRQGEDPSQYRGVLSLNEVEIQRLRRLRQEKGFFSECLIKTPFSSRVARLYPTSEEYELLRTDNIREELIQEQLAEQFERDTRRASWGISHT